MNGGLDLSCAKKIIIRAPQIADCTPDKEYDAGLCYDKCPDKMTGVGPVCWGDSPPDWVNCGMGAAVDSSTCAKMVFDQVTSVGNLALNIATLGASMGSASNVANSLTDMNQLRQQFDSLKTLTDTTSIAKDGLVPTDLNNL